MDDPRLVLIGRLLAEASRRKLRAAAARGTFEAELAAMAERLAVLIHLPQCLSAAEREEETAAIDGWLEDYSARRRSC
jgi:hypothetical protein